MPHLPTMVWDFKDQLQATAQQVRNNGTAETTYYVYDAGGQRVRKVTENQNGRRVKERIYLGGFEIYREYAGNGSTVNLERASLHITDDKRRIVLVETQTTPVIGQPLIRYQLGNHLGSAGVELDGSGALISYGFTLVPAEGEAVGAAAVAEVRDGRAQLLMKGRIDTPALLRAVLDPERGLRTERVIGQFVLMEIARDDRRFLLADTGITVRPDMRSRLDLLRSAVSMAQALGVPRPRVALMAASETVKTAMPETLEAAEIQRRNESGEVAGCDVQGPLSFDLAYAHGAADAKRIGGPVVGAADVLLFPNLLSANLTVKAIMYTADCRYGGVLRGTAAPVVFMSRADTTAVRLDSLALALALVERRT